MMGKLKGCKNFYAGPVAKKSRTSYEEAVQGRRGRRIKRVSWSKSNHAVQSPIRTAVQCDWFHVRIDNALNAADSDLLIVS